MIDSQVYALLATVTALTNLVAGNIKPITATINQGSPVCVFQCEAGETPMNLDGPSDLTPYTVTVAVTHPDLSAVGNALTAVRSALNGYSSGAIALLAYQGESEASDQDEVVYRTQTYSGWAYA